MESIFYRYRNITVLVVVIFAQIVLLAWQVKSDNDVPLVRVWAITAVAPVASAIEGVRNGTTGFVGNYFELRNARAQSRKLRSEVDRLRLENQFLKNELASAQRAEALAGFQARTPSKMIGARVIGTTTGVGGQSVLIDRGKSSGVLKGMAVVTPDGIVGKVLAVYPFASQVLSVTDPGFAAGVESQKNRVHGVLRGVGNGAARVDYVPTGQKVEKGEMFYTSGEDRIFPKGLPAGKVTSVQEGSNFQDISVDPTGVETAPEEVLVIVDPVHQEIPEEAPADAPVFLAPDVKPEAGADAAAPDQPHATAGTQADRLMDQYRKIGEAQKHVFGEGAPGTLPPNFNLKVPGVNAPALPPGSAPPASASKPAPAPKATPASPAPTPVPHPVAPAKPAANVATEP
ncbi:MAG: rod shape-determining protein MreC [Bryobacteraceae bacterium]|jgi:rod shape-determining protein MreC